MRILIASTFVPFTDEDGPTLAGHLRRELAARGFQADTVALPFSAGRAVADQTLALRLLDLSESCGDTIDRLITLGAPAHVLRHPNKVSWFDDRDEVSGGNEQDGAAPPAADRFLRECRKAFAPSRAAAERLQPAVPPDRVLYPPLAADHPFRPGPFGDYLVYAGPTVPATRPDPVIQALPHAGPAVRLVVADPEGGTSRANSLARQAAEAGVGDRVEFVGPAAAERLADWIAGCCGVIDPGDCRTVPATLAAFHAHKPIISASTTGCWAELVENGVNGFVCGPDPMALADAMGRLWRDRATAARLGEGAFETLGRHRVDWDHVVENLLS